MKKALYLVIYGVLHIPLCVNAMNTKGSLPRSSSESALMTLESSEFTQDAPASSPFLRPSAISFFVDRNAKTEEWLNDAGIDLKQKHYYTNETADEELETIKIGFSKKIRVSIIKLGPVLEALLAQEQRESSKSVPPQIPEPIRKILNKNNDAYYNLGFDAGYKFGKNGSSSAKKSLKTQIAIGTTAFGLGALTTYLLARHFK
jgi:hypothetical protein